MKTILSILSLGTLFASPALAADTSLPPAFTQESAGSVGGLFTAGNIFQISGKASAFYQARFLSHGLRLEGAAGIAGQAVDADHNPANGFETPLQNNLNQILNGRVRYDYFITENDTLYTSVFLSHDSAQNLTLRGRVDGGYKRFIFKTETQSLGAEVGAVYTLDFAPLDGDSNGDGKVNIYDHNRFEKSWGNVGGRMLLSYNLSITDVVSLIQTVEVIPNLFPEIEAPYEKSRLGPLADNKLGFLEATIVTSNTTITASVAKNLAASLVVTLIYDNGAIVRRNAYSNADMAMAASLSYKFL